MSLFAISDLHLSLSSNKQMDVFNGWENYVERLADNWRRIVNTDDTVVIPGDISWEMKLDCTYKDFEFINNLPGKKIILKGNHDLWWTSLKKMEDFLSTNGFNSINILHNSCYVVEDYAICGSRGWFFDDTNHSNKLVKREALRIELSINEALKTGFEPILFLHYPPLTKDNVCNEIFDVIKKYNIKRCYYGHIHKAGSFKVVNGIIDGVQLKCVSCDLLDFTPLKLN